MNTVWKSTRIIPVIILTVLVAFAGVVLGAPFKPIVAVDVTVVTGDSQQVDTHRFFADRVDQESGGRLLIKRVDPSVFGGFAKATEALMMGSLQMAHMPNANASVYTSGLMIYDMPFLLMDWDHTMRFARSKAGKAIEEELLKKAGLKILFYYEDGPRAIFNRLRPVRSPEDLNGMKIRVMENPVYIDTLRAFGASPTPMSVTEMYVALQQGVIDGVDIAPYAFVIWKLQEIAKYCSYTNHVNPPAFMCVNAEWFDSLPKDLQDIVIKVSNEAAEYHHKRWTEDRQRVDKLLRNAGVRIDEINSAPFENKVKPIWAKYAERIGGYDRIQAALDLR